MEPTISKSGTQNEVAGAGQTAQDQSLSPQTNVNQATQRANINRGSTQEGVSFSGSGNQGNWQTDRGSNSA